MYLLGPEVVSHEVLLQLLIGVVDAELLQAVVGERLKPVHVQQAWGPGEPVGVTVGLQGPGVKPHPWQPEDKTEGVLHPPQGERRFPSPPPAPQNSAGRGRRGEGTRPRGPRVPPSLDGLGRGRSWVLTVLCANVTDASELCFLPYLTVPPRFQKCFQIPPEALRARLLLLTNLLRLDLGLQGVKGPSWPGHQLSLPGELGMPRHGHWRK